MLLGRLDLRLEVHEVLLEVLGELHEEDQRRRVLVLQTGRRVVRPLGYLGVLQRLGGVLLELVGQRSVALDRACQGRQDLHQRDRVLGTPVERPRRASGYVGAQDFLGLYEFSGITGGQIAVAVIDWF